MASALPRSILLTALCAALAGCGGYSIYNDQRESAPPAPVVENGPSAARPADGDYTVQRGDTIYVISRKLGISVRGLIDANALRPPFQLQPGQVLRMPSNGGGYVVVKGDTLNAVSRKTGVEFATLARINGLRPPYTLHVGQRLGLPAGADAQTAGRPDVIESPNAGGNGGTFTMSSAEPLNPAQQPRVDAQPLAAPPPRPAAEPLAPPPQTAAPAPQPAAAPKPVAAAPAPAPAPLPAMRDRAQPPTAAAAPPPPDKPIVASPPPVAAAPVSPPPVAATPEAQPQPVAAIAPPPAAARPADARPADAPDFIWPVKGTVLVPFGDIAKGQRNDGINIAVPKGTPVMAAADGDVAYAGNELGGFGNMILIAHKGTDYVTVYAHNDKLLVHRGDHVRQGQRIALSGDSGGVSQPQLLFEVRKGVKPIDPQGLLAEALSPASSLAAPRDPG